MKCLAVTSVVIAVVVVIVIANNCWMHMRDECSFFLQRHKGTMAILRAVVGTYHITNISQDKYIQSLTLQHIHYQSIHIPCCHLFCSKYAFTPLHVSAYKLVHHFLASFFVFHMLAIKI